SSPDASPIPPPCCTGWDCNSSGPSPSSPSAVSSGPAASAATPLSADKTSRDEIPRPLRPHLARLRPLLGRAHHDVSRRLHHVVAGRALLDGRQPLRHRRRL